MAISWIEYSKGQTEPPDLLRKKYFKEQVLPSIQSKGESADEAWVQFNQYADSLEPQSQPEVATQKSFVDSFLDSAREGQEVFDRPADLFNPPRVIPAEGPLPVDYSTQFKEPVAPTPRKDFITIDPQGLDVVNTADIPDRPEDQVVGKQQGPRSPIAHERAQRGMANALARGVDNSRFVNFLLNTGARMQDQPLRKMDEYTPKTTMERLAYGVGNLAGDLPAFIAGGAVGGFAGTRGMGAYNDIVRERDPELKDLTDVAIEGGKGILEGLAFSGAMEKANAFTKAVNEKTLATLSPKVSTVLGGGTKIASQVGIVAPAITVTGAVLDNRKPTVQDFTDSALFVGLFPFVESIAKAPGLKGKVVDNAIAKSLAKDFNTTPGQILKDLQTDKGIEYKQYLDKVIEDKAAKTEADIQKQAVSEAIIQADNIRDAQRHFDDVMNTTPFFDKAMLAESPELFGVMIKDNKFFGLLDEKQQNEFIKRNMDHAEQLLSDRDTMLEKQVKKNEFDPEEMVVPEQGKTETPVNSGKGLQGQRIIEARNKALDEVMSDLDAEVQLGGDPYDIASDFITHVNSERLRNVKGFNRGHLLKEAELQFKQKYNLLTPSEESQLYLGLEDPAQYQPYRKWNEVDNAPEEVPAHGQFTPEEYQEYAKIGEGMSVAPGHEGQMRLKEIYGPMDSTKPLNYYDKQTAETQGMQDRLDFADRSDITSYDGPPVGIYDRSQLEQLNKIQSQIRLDETPAAENAKILKNVDLSKPDKEVVGDIMGMAHNVLDNTVSSSPITYSEAVKMRNHLIKKYIASYGKAVSETMAGKEIADMVEKCQEQAELHSRGYIADYKIMINDILGAKKSRRNVLGEALFDLMDSPKEMHSAIMDEYNLSTKERAVVDQSYNMMRAYIDNIHNSEVKNSGLTQRNRRVENWTIHGNASRWLVKENGETVGFFTGKKDAKMFQGNNDWSLEHELAKYIVRDEFDRNVGEFSTKKEAEDFKKSELITAPKYRENYAPHELKDEYMRDGKDRDKFLQYLIDSKQIPADDVGLPIADRKALAAQYLDKILTEKRQGNIQLSRELTIPKEFLKRDLGVWAEYLDNVADRLERAKIYGAKDEKIFGKLLDVAREAGEKYGREEKNIIYDRAETFVKAMTGRLESNRGDSAITTTIMNLMAFKYMVFSSLSQVTQMTVAASRTGSIRSLIKGISRLEITDREYSKDIVTRCGANSNLLKRHFLASAFGVTGQGTLGRLPATLLKFNGFNFMDTKSREIAAMTGICFSEHCVDMLNKGKNPEKWMGKLKDMGLNGEEIIARRDGNGKVFLTPDEKLIAARKCEVDTNFRSHINNMPEFRQNPWGKVITQFKTFSFSQTKMIRDHILNPARHGNFTPLFYFLVLNGVSAAAVGEVRDFIFGRDSSIGAAIDGDQWDRTLYVASTLVSAGTFGMTESVFQAVRYGQVPAGPFLSSLQNMGTHIGRFSGTGHTEELVKAFNSAIMPGGEAINAAMSRRDKAEKKAMKASEDPRKAARMERAKIRRENNPRWADKHPAKKSWYQSGDVKWNSNSK